VETGCFLFPVARERLVKTQQTEIWLNGWCGDLWTVEISGGAVVPSCVYKWSINPFTNTHPVYNHTYTSSRLWIGLTRELRPTDFLIKIHISHCSHLDYISYPFHLLDHFNSIWWSVKIIKLVCIFFPAFYKFLSFRPIIQIFSLHPVLRHY
jgi:hypothetical protein